MIEYRQSCDRIDPITYNLKVVLLFYFFDLISSWLFTFFLLLFLCLRYNWFKINLDQFQAVGNLGKIGVDLIISVDQRFKQKALMTFHFSDIGLLNEQPFDPSESFSVYLICLYIKIKTV